MPKWPEEYHFCQSKTKCRKHFAEVHKNLSPEDWETKFFSDKSKFKLIDSDGRTYIRRKNESYDRRCVTKTVKFGGGSLMF